MAADTAISWAHDTFNLVLGCTKVSEACKHCYAEKWAHRFRPGHTLWGPGSERLTLAAAYWQKPLRWNQEATATGKRRRVFCSSLADVFEDHPTVDQERQKLWELIERTPMLDWLLLTKRAHNIQRHLPWTSTPWGNVWLGTTVENQERAMERLDVLASIPARVRFVSAEPLLGPVSLRAWMKHLQWVIVGGESGQGARPMHPWWVEFLQQQCADARVAFHFKQWGEYQPTGPVHAPQATVCHCGFSSDQYRAVMRHHYKCKAPKQQVMYRVGTKAAGGDLYRGQRHQGVPDPAVLECAQCPTAITDHYGSRRCRSGALAAGGTHAHCSCETCY